MLYSEFNTLTHINISVDLKLQSKVEMEVLQRCECAAKFDLMLHFRVLSKTFMFLVDVRGTCVAAVL